MNDLRAQPIPAVSVRGNPFAAVSGVAADVINGIDWAAHPLGPVASWPEALKTILGTMLRSRHPMFLFWGPELFQFYNDAYLPSFGAGKHPRAMGQRARECWAEVWPIIWPQIDDVMSRGKASWNEDHLVPIFRNGRIEEVFWTYGYSPACDGEGRISGTLVVCTETTSRVLTDRRLQIIRRLSEATAECNDVVQIRQRALELARDAGFDIPFLVAYDETGASAGMTATGVVPEGEAPTEFDVAIRSLVSAGDNEALALPPGTPVPSGPWPEPPTRIFVARSREPTLGSFVFGISSRLPLDARYLEFFADFLHVLERGAVRVSELRARTEVEAERRSILLKSPIPTALVIGPQHLFELANPAFLRMVGRDVIGKTYAEAFPEIEGTVLPDLLRRVYETGETYVAEEHHVRFDRRGTGELGDYHYKFTLEPVRRGSGEVYGMIAVATDITDQVNARQALERTNAERQQLVEQLEASHRSKDAFLATVSHELRTPLSAILGWARMLGSGKVAPDKTSRALEVIERNALAQVQLIDDLLDVSRIIAGKLRLEVRSLSLIPIVEAAVESVQQGLDAKALRLVCDFDPQAGNVVGDTHRIQQVVWNLLSNAVKFTPKGGEIRLALERNGASVKLSVSDTGQGIPKELLPTVFDRFKQADGSAARVHGGLGLGLAIARHIVELHGGSISAFSEGQGRGASFVVSLPIDSSGGATSAGPFRAPTVSRAPILEFEHPKELQGLTVLVVDDEADTRELLAEVLRQLGSAVLTAASAEEALALLDVSSPRVLVSDIGMPRMDGYEFIERVRSRPPERGGRVVALALTAFASAEDRRKALRAGFQMHLAKPVEPAEFVASLASLAQLAIATSH